MDLDIFIIDNISSIQAEFNERNILKGNFSEAMRIASERGNYEFILSLLNRGVDIHVDNDVALRYAAENGRLHTVEILLEHGANIHANDNYPIRYAAKNGHYEVVKLLYERGASIKTANSNVLYFAIRGGNKKIIEFLLDIRIKSIRSSINNLLSYTLRCKECDTTSLFRNSDTLSKFEIICILLKNGAKISHNSYEFFRTAFEVNELHVLRKLYENNIFDSLPKIFNYAFACNNIFYIRDVLINKDVFDTNLELDKAIANKDVHTIDFLTNFINL